MHSRDVPTVATPPTYFLQETMGTWSGRLEGMAVQAKFPPRSQADRECCNANFVSCSKYLGKRTNKGCMLPLVVGFLTTCGHTVYPLPSDGASSPTFCPSIFLRFFQTQVIFGTHYGLGLGLVSVLVSRFKWIWPGFLDMAPSRLPEYIPVLSCVGARGGVHGSATVGQVTSSRILFASSARGRTVTMPYPRRDGFEFVTPSGSQNRGGTAGDGQGGCV